MEGKPADGGDGFSDFIGFDGVFFSWKSESLQVMAHGGYDFMLSLATKAAAFSWWAVKSMVAVEYSSNSFRRSISVVRCLHRGKPALRISEKCSSGKLFFVVVPSLSVSGDWNEFLKLLQDLVMVRPSDPPKLIRRSFAEVVALKGLPKSGRCSSTVVDGVEMIEVFDEGVSERLDFLSKGLVLRFSEPQAVVWEAFRVWAHRQWGIPVSATFLSLGDDLWFLACGSISEVNRILELKRWSFGDVRIQMDTWIKMAGRSNVTVESGFAWVIARGIPLHLRSPDLFRQLGDFCGGFLCAEDGLNLSSIRLKVKVGGVIPDEVPLCHGCEVFPIRLEPDGWIPVARHGVKDSFVNSWKSKGVGFAVQKGSVDETTSSEFPSSSSEAEVSELAQISELDLDAPKAEKTRRRVCVRNCTFSEEKSLSLEVVGQMSEIETSQIANGVEVPFVGLKLDQLGHLVISSSSQRKDKQLGFILETMTTWTLPDNVGLSFSPIPYTFLALGLKNNDLCLFKMSSVQDEGCSPLSALNLFKPGVVLGWSTCSVSSELGEGDDSRVAAFTLEVSSLELFPCSEVVLEEEVEGQEDDGRRMCQSEKAVQEAELETSVRTVARIIQLELNGSLEEGEIAASTTCKEVIRRREKSVRLSRSERELKKLGVLSSPGSAPSYSGRQNRVLFGVWWALAAGIGQLNLLTELLGVLLPVGMSRWLR
ncbi:hypothetical protein LINPERPRIM_LOCUS17236 [Linum perenne]